MRHLRSPSLVLALGLGLAPLVDDADLQAQDAPVELGARIRVTLGREAADARAWRRSARRWYGTVERATGDSVALRLRDGRAYTFAWAEMDRLERHLGRHTRAHGASHGALFGGVTLGVATAMAAGIGASTCTYECGLNVVAVPFVTLAGATTGMVLGAVFGALGPGEHFERVRPLPRAALHLAPGHVGLAFALP